jgi:hypothetical protein
MAARAESARDEHPVDSCRHEAWRALAAALRIYALTLNETPGVTFKAPLEALLQGFPREGFSLNFLKNALSDDVLALAALHEHDLPHCAAWNNLGLAIMDALNGYRAIQIGDMLRKNNGALGLVIGLSVSRPNTWNVETAYAVDGRRATIIPAAWHTTQILDVIHTADSTAALSETLMLVKRSS